MATRATVPLASRRILVTGFGALLVLYALTAAWVVVNSDTESGSADTDRFVVGTVTIEQHDATVTLLGTVPTVEAGSALVDSLVERPDVTVVVNRLVADETAPMPALATIHTGLDALRGGPG